MEGLRNVGEQVFTWNMADRLAFFHKAYVELDNGEMRKAFDAKAATELALDGLAASLFKLRPHVLFVVSGFFVDGNLLDQARATGTRVVALMTEQPYETGRELKLAEHCDLVLLNDPTNIELFEAKAPTLYAPHAYRPKVHCPGPTDEKPSDLVFCGTSYPSRIDFFEAMNLHGLDVSLAGNWMRLTEQSPLRKHVVHDIDECFDNADAVNLYRAAKCGINFYRREADAEEVEGWAMGPREVELAATGLFFLRDPRPEGDEVLDMLPTFESPEEASDLLRWWLAHDDQREAAAQKARAAIADRTFENHAATLLRLLGTEE
jgi:hypothetical protein